MSRRCRASLIQGAGGVGGELSSGCDCGRLGGISEPCFEPVVYGSNILLDPGFEQHAGLIGENTGPDGETFPGERSWGSQNPQALYWSRGTSQPYLGDTPHWAVKSNNGQVEDNDIVQENRFHLSTQNPHQGFYHARFVVPAPPDPEGIFPTHTAEIQPIGFEMCTPISHWGFSSTPGRGVMGAIVQPGDLAVLSAHVMADVITDSPRVFVQIVPFAPDFSTRDNNFWTDELITTSYAPYTTGVFIPADRTWIGAAINPYTDGSRSITTILDVDTVQLTLLQAGQNILLCAQSGLVTIDNSTTETSFL